jgi:SNF2 family DNA or RNA helicase
MYLELESGVYKALSFGMLKPLTLDVKPTYISVRFPYDKNIVSEVKSMQTARWNPDNKFWTVAKSHRNFFAIRALISGYKGALVNDPYAPYNSPIITIERKPRFNKSKNKELTPYVHQFDMADHIITRLQCLIAGEMGVGKTLSMILALEYLKEIGQLIGSVWYVGPTSAKKSVERELIIWGSKIRPEMMTYEELVKRAKNWEKAKAPQAIVFDECSRIKNPTTQRSQAAFAFAKGIRDDWGIQSIIIAMSGTPAPKSPADWWSQCEVACPGFLKEGDIHKFRNRLELIIQKESRITNGVYPHLVTWRDNEQKCNVCGELETHVNHDPNGVMFNAKSFHSFEKSVNEVSKLYRRMKGLVLVKMKKDCLDLPEKRYRMIEIKPSKSILRAAGLILAAAKTTIEGMTLLRELSDGFQYIDKATGNIPCHLCKGTKVYVEKQEIPKTCPNCADTPFQDKTEYGSGELVISCPFHTPEYEDVESTCPNCGGSGEVKSYERSTKEVASPKEDILKQILEEHEESGRLVVFAGFQGSIDKCVRVCHTQGWHTIRVDGRGWQVTTEKNIPLDIEDHLSLFQDWQDKYPKVVFVGHPKSGGMGLTLTASRSIFYYSNDFDGESRTQSEDRIHRPGMDENKGATIIDCVHLPTDAKVLDNLRKKRKLELMSLGEVKEAIDKAEGERET